MCPSTVATFDRVAVLASTQQGRLPAWYDLVTSDVRLASPSTTQRFPSPRPAGRTVFGASRVKACWRRGRARTVPPMFAPSYPITMQPLRKPQVAATAAMLAQAFDDDPAYRYLFSSPASRQKRLSDFFERNLRSHLPFECTQVAVDAGGAVLGTVTVRPLGGIRVAATTMLWELLPFLTRHGLGPVRRMFWLKRTYDELEARAAQHSLHRHVHMMAIIPAGQGTGIGSALLGDALMHARKSDPQTGSPPAPTVVTTHFKRNLGFYQRAGFEVIAEDRLAPPGGDPYTVWSMRTTTPG